jgi:hypothetical protein
MLEHTPAQEDPIMDQGRCRECDYDLPSHTPACPHCGATVSVTPVVVKPTRRWVKIVGWTMAIGFCGWVYLTLYFADPSARRPGPSWAPGKECSRERINYLAGADPDRMMAEFRVCVERAERLVRQRATFPRNPN